MRFLKQNLFLKIHSVNIQLSQEMQYNGPKEKLCSVTAAAFRNKKKNLFLFPSFHQVIFLNRTILFFMKIDREIREHKMLAL